MNHLFEEIIRELRIVEVGLLHNHEDIIPQNFLRLKEAMLNIGQLVDPLIVDEKSLVVLDGNHRIKVLEMIMCPRAVCQFVDYSNPKIKVGTWIPVSAGLGPKELRDAGLELEECGREEGLKKLAEKKAVFMLSKKDGNFLVEPGEYTLEALIEAQKKALGKLDDTELWFYPDDEGEELVAQGMSVLYRKVYTKGEIVERALSGKIFPPKSTRHVIPNRIIRLNMRLGWLHEGEKEARQYLERTLRERMYNGNVRKYSEPVIVIY